MRGEVPLKSQNNLSMNFGRILKL
ncbi:UNVERIFIED_CONTAM: hypothetical protein GTU68_034087 [Idotea baltica]|nr:hypothetical protein [Idotea baltica]